MSFLDNLGNFADEARGLLGQAAPDDVSQAAQDHVDSMDSTQLGDHLADSVSHMDTGAVGQFAQTLLSSLKQNGHSEAEVNAAGIDTAAASSGDAGSVIDLIEHAKDHPEALAQAAKQFVQANPAVVAQFAPDFLKGILGRLTG